MRRQPRAPAVGRPVVATAPKELQAQPWVVTVVNYRGIFPVMVSVRHHAVRLVQQYTGQLG